MRLIIVFLIIVLNIYVANAYDGYDYYGYPYDGYDSESYDQSSDYISIYSSYDSSAGSMRDSSAYQSHPYGSGTAISLWIQSSTGQLIQSTQCPLFSQVMLIANSPGGSAIMTEIYPDGQEVQNYYQFQPGYTEIVFAADQPGRHILSYELYGQLSNVAILDVTSSDSGLHKEETFVAGYPIPAPTTVLNPENLSIDQPSAKILIPDPLPIDQPPANTPPIINHFFTGAFLNLVGVPITFTVYASDPDGDLIYYRFWIMGPDADSKGISDYQLMEDWTTASSWTWFPKDYDIGSFDIMVEVRDKNNADSWDDYSECNIYILEEFPKPEPGTRSSQTKTNAKGMKKRPRNK